jgi:hypothetical protein
MELSNTEIKIAVKNMAREMVKRVTVRNADEPKFDGEGFLLDKNGRPFFVYNGTVADLIIRKYKAMGVNLTAVKDRTGDVYFKKA